MQSANAQSTNAQNVHTITLRISTWNLDWLIDKTPQTSRKIPLDIPYRTAHDYKTLAAYVSRLKPDLIGVQEVGSISVLTRLFPKTTYQILLSNDTILQHTAFIARKQFQLHRNPDLTDLSISSSKKHTLRNGLDVTVTFPNSLSRELRILVVHLKTGCWDNSLQSHRRACYILRQQFAILKHWIQERAKEKVAFAIIGDFNRRLTPEDPFFLTLSNITPLDLTTANRSSPCHGGEYFIDHIILGGAAIGWEKVNSLRVMRIPQHNGEMISDNCPVSITLRIPTRTH
ncbi:MAG: endonuclease/exonuclease/phosphatase family protein [Acetobacter sp.]|nr:endonuclease/exonuclease/phosphatase family protein [Acetobacter sp.]